MSIETTVVLTGIAVWLAHGWYLNQRLKAVHDKLDRLGERFDGLRTYLYEIDPQFDDERAARLAFDRGDAMFAGMDDLALKSEKETAGKRTLDTSF